MFMPDIRYSILYFKRMSKYAVNIINSILSIR